MSDTTLAQRHSSAKLIHALLILSALFLIAGLTLPVMTLKELVFWKHTFSILTGIKGLMVEGHYVLAVIIFLFSIVFPIIKLGVLFSIWYLPLNSQRCREAIHWLGISGKWSMLDVFVVAITIVITKISNFASAVPRVGIYFFAASVVLAMLITMRMDKLLVAETAEMAKNP